MHLARILLLFFAAIIVTSALAAIPPTTPALSSSSAPALPIFLDNSAEAIPSDPAWSSALNEKLATFKAAHGITFIVRLQPKSPTAEEDKVPGAYMRSLAAKLGTAQSGIVAVYFADEDDWRLWVGDELTAKFSDKTGTPKELTKSGAIHDAKEALSQPPPPNATPLSLRFKNPQPPMSNPRPPNASSFTPKPWSTK